MSHLRIVSGGQTGVDRAALDAALAGGVGCGGWCPRGRRAEDGPISALYPVQETASARYGARTRANVRDSDATLIIVRGMDGFTGGTRLAGRQADRLGRPLMVVDLAAPEPREATAARIAAWLAEHRIAVLNVAGPRESRSPGIYAAARALLASVIRSLTR